jgi:maltose O-acetyltransferase
VSVRRCWRETCITRLMQNSFLARERARDLCQALNATREAEQQARRRILSDLFGRGGETVWMQPPFYCDYGSNIELGERVFFNFNCVVLDVCPVRIGAYTLFGPAVQIYTGTNGRCLISDNSVWICH